MDELKPNAKRALDLLFLLWVNFGILVILLASFVFNFILTLKIRSGQIVSEDVIASNKIILSAAYVVSWVLFVICFVCFLRWFRRAYHNLHKLNTNLMFHEHWAVTAWFIPFLNLVRPFRIMNEMYEKAGAQMVAIGAMYKSPGVARVKYWWFLLLFLQMMNVVIFMISNFQVMAISKVAMSGLHTFYVLLLLAATLLTINVVKTYAEVESEIAMLKSQINHEKEDVGLFSASDYKKYLGR